MFAIVDYGMGNLRSVLNAFNFIEEEAIVTSRPEDLANASGIVLPGVGAFADAMRNLRDAGLYDVIERDVWETGKPFLGICLGMQLVATKSLEGGVHRGFDWISGTVEKIAERSDGAALRVPHIGWNTVSFRHEGDVFSDLGAQQEFYFVHSYKFSPDDPKCCIGVCEYGQDIVSMVEQDNIFAVQFHPEKSHHVGLRLLRNWCALTRQC